MTSIFIATIKIKVIHNKGTHIDTNSVKGLIGPDVALMRLRGVDCLCEVGDKTEGTPKAVEIKLDSLTGQYGDVRGAVDVIDISDFDIDYAI